MKVYDAIVVGAGPAGSSAALTMAQKGVNVLLIERGPFPGSKNMFGGTIYARATEEVVPAFWKEAPLERAVTSDELWLLEKDSAFKFGFNGLQFGKTPYNKFTVLRSNFDQWLAQKAVDAGATLINNVLVKDLLYEKRGLIGQRVAGVKTDHGERIKSPVVILAEGVNAFLTKKVGLRSNLPAHTMTLYVKETISLARDRIEERFQLNKNEGAILGMIGYPTAGAVGKGGIWTNRESLSLVVGAYLDELVKKKLSPFMLLERFKIHPLIKRLIENGERVDFQAHMIPKGGYKFIPKLYADGVVIVGDAAVMISGRHGTDLAMLSGKFAGETVVQAKAKGDFTTKTLATYQHKLSSSFFMQDIKSGKDSLKYFEKYPDSDYLISNIANEFGYNFFRENLITSKERKKIIAKELFTKQSPYKSIVDLYSAYQHWGVF